jgi:hypothetical protein
MNWYRQFQAILLYQEMKKDGLKGVDHHLLMTLARYMALETKPGTLTVVDTCFPSLQALADETGGDRKTVSRSIERMKNKYIRTSKIPGWRYAKKYDGCRYHVITEKFDLIVVPENYLKPSSVSGAPKATKAPIPVSSPEVLAADAAVCDSLDTPLPAPKDAVTVSHTDEGAAARETVFAYLEEKFGEHRTMTDFRARTLMKGCIDTCLSLAGDPRTVIATLQSLTEQQNEKLNAADRLGGYMGASFPNWLMAFREHEASSASEGSASPKAHKDASGLEILVKNVIGEIGYYGDWPCFDQMQRGTLKMHLRFCAQKAGSPSACLQVIREAKRHIKFNTMKEIMTSEDVGSLIGQHFPAWLDNYGHVISDQYVMSDPGDFGM